MKHELLDLYHAACESKDEDVIKAFQRARDRIGPQIAVDLILENNRLRAELEKIKQEMGRNTNQQVISALKLTYRKHCLADDSIGWIELEDILRDALCEAIGDKAFQDFLGEVED